MVIVILLVYIKENRYMKI